MKVFLSWSGPHSHKLALVFRDWLPSVIQAIVPYVSSEDIDKGARWSTDIAKELENSTFGILCVTRDNINAPWLIFEAGALSKTMDKSLVTPFLFDIKRSEVDGPMLQFQSTVFDRDDLKKLVKTLNKACEKDGLPDDRLEKAFSVWYPALESELNRLKGARPEDLVDGSTAELEEPKTQEILEEILELSRINQKLIRDPKSDAKLDRVMLQMDSLLRKVDRVERLRIPEGARSAVHNTLARLLPQGCTLHSTLSNPIHCTATVHYSGKMEDNYKSFLANAVKLLHGYSVQLKHIPMIEATDRFSQFETGSDEFNA